MRRPAPRPIADVLGRLVGETGPQTLLARTQAIWPRAAGTLVAKEAEPVSEQGGTLTVGCRSAVWANELELLAPDLLEALNDALGGLDEGPLKALRFRVVAAR